MRQMSRDVWKCQIGGADELNRRSAEHSVVLFTDESSILDGFLDDVVHVLLHYVRGGVRNKRTEEIDTHCLCTDNADIILVRLLGIQCHILTQINNIPPKRGRRRHSRCPIKNRIPIRDI